MDVIKMKEEPGKWEVISFWHKQLFSRNRFVDSGVNPECFVFLLWRKAYSKSLYDLYSSNCFHNVSFSSQL